MAWNAGNLIFMMVIIVMVMVIMMMMIVVMDVMVGPVVNVLDMLEYCVRMVVMFYVIRYMNDDMFMM